MTPELKRRVLSLLMKFPTETEVKPTLNNFGPGERQYSNTNKMIAKQLGVTERTVKAYISSIAKSWDIKEKDGLQQRQRIVYLEAMRAGLVPPLQQKASGRSPPDEVTVIADVYAQHEMTCKKCSASFELCDDGLRLMKQFQDALHAVLNARGKKVT